MNLTLFQIEIGCSLVQGVQSNKMCLRDFKMMCLLEEKFRIVNLNNPYAGLSLKKHFRTPIRRETLVFIVYSQHSLTLQLFPQKSPLSLILKSKTCPLLFRPKQSIHMKWSSGKHLKSY